MAKTPRPRADWFTDRRAVTVTVTPKTYMAILAMVDEVRPNRGPRSNRKLALNRDRWLKRNKAAIMKVMASTLRKSLDAVTGEAFYRVDSSPVLNMLYGRDRNDVSGLLNPFAFITDFRTFPLILWPPAGC